MSKKIDINRPELSTLTPPELIHGEWRTWEVATDQMIESARIHVRKNPRYSGYDYEQFIAERVKHRLYQQAMTHFQNETEEWSNDTTEFSVKLIWDIQFPRFELTLKYQQISRGIKLTGAGNEQRDRSRINDGQGT